MKESVRKCEERSVDMKEAYSKVRAQLPSEKKYGQKEIVKTCPKCGAALSGFRRSVQKHIGFVRCGRCGHPIIKMDIIY